ncbi:energy-coupling factor transporter transmembrane protein EcfT [Microlunatus sp. Gsoil 973]|uniref:energy-coupling factor transporter transmembrane component T family protein n=1 Tax=Microlunatus sp. Gsoil 973 TaxID=2672569 RepID=UPI0012B4702B|nr:energy-coupling factor transporter transmembrane component T [Microlunatus sp. Gsoil 973]QGN31840.1 energy-coupling factor transporter transmembrane protein EcfT [Microlunatus sp. Gsoil 973]
MSGPDGVLNRIPPAVKFSVLFGAGIGLYLITWWPALAGTLLIAVVALLATRVPVARLVRPIAGLVIIIGAVVIMTGLTGGWPGARLSGLRLITLCLLAYAISLSTRFAEFLAVVERIVAPTARIGLNPARISLALSLTVRFIPDLRDTYQGIREAQYARGLQHRPVATLVPLIIRTLQSADQIAEAIDARAYDTTQPTEEPS